MFDKYEIELISNALENATVVFCMLYEMELNLVDIWLEKHSTDTSGWSYLEYFLDGLVNQSIVVG
ncbi:hypothetical protein KSF78_0001651 [Schistosoma japonicum]|nr:hypothetical protein KSF78_0001651 [Schistosoma japonicum]